MPMPSTLAQHMVYAMDPTQVQSLTDFATTAWLLEDSHFLHQNLCHGITHVSGLPSKANTYCAELQDSMLYSWPSKESVHSMQSPLDQ